MDCLYPGYILRSTTFFVHGTSRPVSRYSQEKGRRRQALPWPESEADTIGDEAPSPLLTLPVAPPHAVHKFDSWRSFTSQTEADKCRLQHYPNPHPIAAWLSHRVDPALSHMTCDHQELPKHGCTTCLSPRSTSLCLIFSLLFDCSFFIITASPIPPRPSPLVSRRPHPNTPYPSPCTHCISIPYILHNIGTCADLSQRPAYTSCHFLYEQ